MQFQSRKSLFQGEKSNPQTNQTHHFDIVQSAFMFLLTLPGKTIGQILAEERGAEIYPCSGTEGSQKPLCFGQLSSWFPNPMDREGPQKELDHPLCVALQPVQHSWKWVKFQAIEEGKQPFILCLPTSSWACLHTTGFLIAQLRMVFCQVKYQPSSLTSD